jgi:hypothetical protein
MRSTMTAILGIAILTVGCVSHGNANLRGPHSSVDVELYGDNAATLPQSAAYYDTQVSYAQAHAHCMKTGKCWGYGGGLGTDLELNYAGTGAIGGRPQTRPAARTGSETAEDPCAREMAADAIRGMRSIDRGEEVRLKGSPSCRKDGKGGAQ